MSSRGDGQPPPVPPRPSVSGDTYGHSIAPYPSVPFGFGPFSGPAYTHPSMYGGHVYGGGYGSYGNTPESSFARLAEESSRGAFQSIDSLVTAVNAVANMLSSTHNAVYSSFRAVIGMVEQLSRLRSQATILLTLSVFKWLKRIWRAILVLLGMRPANYASRDNEVAWALANSSEEAGWPDMHGATGGGSVNWPAVLFWLVALGGPYLIYKCVASMVSSIENSRKWATGSAEHYKAQALYDFTGQNEQELSFRKGQMLRVAPKHHQPHVRGWLLASSDDGRGIGLVPLNYLKMIGRKSVSPPPTQRSIVDRGYEQVFRRT